MTACDTPLVEEAVRNLYDAIDAMAANRGLDAMRRAWHHTDDVTGKHPSGGWARGWEEVWVTWELLASFGREDRGGGKLLSCKTQIYGDVATATCLYKAAPAWGGDEILCSNVLRRLDGEWKVVHHHADNSNAVSAALEKMMAHDAEPIPGPTP